MREQKRYYWIKLKTDFFNQETIDFLLSQENGCQYIVLYQMLCLNTANNNGEMATKIGEMIVPYDINKIVRDTKYFTYDTVAVALELFKKLGLIYLDEGQFLKIANFENMVGSESVWAEKKRLYREKQAKELGLSEGQKEDNVRQENRDKILEYRDKSIDKDIDKNIISSETEVHIPYKEIIDHLNSLAGTNYKASTKKTKDLIKARFNEGFVLEDFKKVIENKTREWKYNSEMNKYLRPETLFGTKFESYLNQNINIQEKSNNNNFEDAGYYDWINEAIDYDWLNSEKVN